MTPQNTITMDKIISKVPSDRSAKLFVWSIWVVMLLIAFFCIARYGWNIPLAEDWYFVAPLTKQEPDLVQWLWAQNNEHRVPLPRLILLTLFQFTRGDFRAGMGLNVVTLGLLAGAMIWVARHLRQGRTNFSDAFFPLALLHLGNWENLFWSWQFSFVLSTVLTCIILLITIAHQPTRLRPGLAVVAGTCLMLLPLCGATGLISVPLLSLWLGYWGILQWRAAKHAGGPRWVSSFLIGAAIVALGLIGLYFVGYEQPSWNPPNPGIGSTLKTTSKFLAFGFGPAATKFWALSVSLALSLLLPSLWVAMLAVLRHQGAERQRALGILLCFGNLILFALAMGWGRAGAIPLMGLPLRYVLLAVPLFCVIFFVWELYGSSRLRSLAQGGLLLAMVIALPFNTTLGLRWGDWYQQGMQAIEQDLLIGTSPALLAQHHRDFLIHWWSEDQLAAGIQMLHEANIGPFAQIQEESVNSER
jgi:hypothetical protein